MSGMTSVFLERVALILVVSIGLVRGNEVVSILSASFGQTWCAKNIIRNVCEQEWRNLELVLCETGQSPSFLQYTDAKIQLPSGGLRARPALAYSGRLEHCLYADVGIDFKYYFFNASKFDSHISAAPPGRDDETERPRIGRLRNFMMSQAAGAFLVNMDNDDFYGPKYIYSMMQAFRAGASMVGVQESAVAAVLPGGNISISIPPRLVSRAQMIHNNVNHSCIHGRAKVGQVLNGHCHVTDTEYHIGLTRQAWLRCPYSNRGMSEAHQVSDCVQRRRLNRYELSFVDPDKAAGLIGRQSQILFTEENKHLLLAAGLLDVVKFKSGLSTTSQVFLYRGNPVNTSLFGQLQSLDMCHWQTLLKTQAAVYDIFHDMHHDYSREDFTVSQSTLDCRLFPQGKVPNFRRRPGKLFLHSDNTTLRMPPSECLEHCSNLLRCAQALVHVNTCILFFTSVKPKCQQAPWHIFDMEAYEKEISDYGPLLQPACG